MLIDAVDDAGQHHEVWVDRVVPFGGRFKAGGVRYVRVPSAGGKPVVVFQGPTEMWTEPPGSFRKLSKDGLPMMESMGDVHEHLSRQRDLGKDLEWVR